MEENNIGFSAMMKYIRENGDKKVLKIKMQAPFLKWAPNNYPTFYKLQTILHFHSSEGNARYTTSLSPPCA